MSGSLGPNPSWRRHPFSRIYQVQNSHTKYRVASCQYNADGVQKFHDEPGLLSARMRSSHQAIVDRLKRGVGKRTPNRGSFPMHISNEGILVILFVGLVAGWPAGKIVRGTGFGLIGDILVGIAGALVASFLFPKLGIHIGTGLISEIIYSAIGAVILLLVVRLLRGRM